jgi:hypothetical protein
MNNDNVQTETEGEVQHQGMKKKETDDAISLLLTDICQL